MTAADIIEVLSRHVALRQAQGDLRLPALADAGLEGVDSRDGMPTMYVAPEHLVPVCTLLRDVAELRFAFLADVTAVDYYPREPRFEVLYILVCPGVAGYGDTPKRLRLKVRVPADGHLPSLWNVWASANWGEREVYDFFGLHFDGHPDLRRILMPDDWEGYPMRKDYPVQIRQAVKTYEPLQVSEEEFVANVEASRRRSRQD